MGGKNSQNERREKTAGFVIKNLLRRESLVFGVLGSGLFRSKMLFGFLKFFAMSFIFCLPSYVTIIDRLLRRPPKADTFSNPYHHQYKVHYRYKLFFNTS